MDAHKIRNTKRLANVCVGSTRAHRSGVVCLGVACRFWSGNSAGALDIEVVIPDSSKNRAHWILTASQAIKPQSHGFGIRFSFEIDSKWKPVCGACWDRRRCSQHDAICFIHNLKHGSAGTFKLIGAYVAFKPILSVRFDYNELGNAVKGDYRIGPVKDAQATTALVMLL